MGNNEQFWNDGNIWLMCAVHFAHFREVLGARALRVSEDRLVFAVLVDMPTYDDGLMERLLWEETCMVGGMICDYPEMVIDVVYVPTAVAGADDDWELIALAMANDDG